MAVAFMILLFIVLIGIVFDIVGVAVASAESGADYSVLGDFNSDGAVTPSDASEILSYYADQQTGQ